MMKRALRFLTLLLLTAPLGGLADAASARTAFEKAALAEIPSSVCMRYYAHAPDEARYDKAAGTAKYLFVLSYRKSTRARFLEGIVSDGQFRIGRMLDFGQPPRKVLSAEFEALRTEDAMFAIRLDGASRPYVCLYPKRSFATTSAYPDVHSLTTESPASSMVGNLKTSSVKTLRGGKLRWGVFGCRVTYTGADGLVVDLGTVDADSSIATATILAKCRTALETAHPDRTGTISDRDVMDWCRACTRTYEPLDDSTDSATADETAASAMSEPYAWGERNLYVAEQGVSAPSVVVITGIVSVASSPSLATPSTDTTALLEFVGGEPWFHVPAVGWTNLVGGTALAEGASFNYRLVFDLGADRACCSVGRWSVGWMPFGGGDELLGYSTLTGSSATVLTFTSVPDEYNPSVPKTQWTWKTSGTAVLLTEIVADTNQTPWVFKLTSGGALSVATTGLNGTSSKKINLRTLPADCPYVIKSTTKATDSTTKYGGYFMNNGAGGNNSGRYSVAAGSIIEEIYMPDSLTTLSSYSFANCTNLVVCDFTPNSRLATIGVSAFYSCPKLERLRLTERLITLSGSAGLGAIVSCAKLQLEGPTLPNSLTSMGGNCFNGCPNLIHGRLTLGGSDTNDLKLVNSAQKMFQKETGISEIVFGKAVTSFVANSAYKKTAFVGCTGITNIVCRNPSGFNFGTYFAALSGLRQYDLYGWPTGTLPANGEKTRILAPHDDANWRALVTNEAVFAKWDALTDAQRAVYWTNFPSNGVGAVTIPEGRLKAATTGATIIPKNVWIVFDKWCRSPTMLLFR